MFRFRAQGLRVMATSPRETLLFLPAVGRSPGGSFERLADGPQKRAERAK